MSLLIQLWSASKAILILVPYEVSGDALAQLAGDPACKVVDITSTEPDKMQAANGGKGPTDNGVDTLDSLVPKNSPIHQHLSHHHQREQVLSVNPNLLSCTNCDMTCDNEVESVACDGPGCGQAVCACDHDFCL